jgi:hypothetical protein
MIKMTFKISLTRIFPSLGYGALVIFLPELTKIPWSICLFTMLSVLTLDTIFLLDMFVSTNQSFDQEIYLIKTNYLTRIIVSFIALFFFYVGMYLSLHLVTIV